MTPRYALTGFLKFFRLCVGGDAHIAPFDINKFAKNFLKNGAILPSVIVGLLLAYLLLLVVFGQRFERQIAGHGLP